METLAWLRLTAIAGQTLTVLVVAYGFHLVIPMAYLFSGIGVLGLFAAFAQWRAHRARTISESEAIAHIGVDIVVLVYLLYWTGGAINPFVTLLLVPIAMAATALSRTGIAVIAGGSSLAYLYLYFYYIPLPLVYSSHFTNFQMFALGMAVNFAITASLLGVFITRLASGLRQGQRHLQQIRERTLRNEGILAMATQSAAVAHELNTPLSTMRTLISELSQEHEACPELHDDLNLLASQVERCHQGLKRMVETGKLQLEISPLSFSLGGFVQSCLSRFRLLRPEIEIRLQLSTELANETLLLPTDAEYALINLLGNAADASAETGHNEIILKVCKDQHWLEWIIRDHGPGFSTHPVEAFVLGQSGKSRGLGIGLALSEATVERLQGELITSNIPEGGAEIRLRLPLSVIGAHA